LKKQVEEEITKRQKGIFSPLNNTATMVIISILMVAVCACWKYYERTNKKPQDESYFTH
jgi:predicted negative regulator of RcsB-dependent stress response